MYTHTHSNAQIYTLTHTHTHIDTGVYDCRDHKNVSLRPLTLTENVFIPQMVNVIDGDIVASQFEFLWQNYVHF